MPYKDPEKAREYSTLYARTAKARAKRLAWKEANRALLCEQQKDRYKNNKEYHNKISKKHHYKRNYNLTIEQAEAIKSLGCFACGTKIGRLHIDHDHDTGEVRGCLCHGCNAALGLLKDNPDRVFRLYEYIFRKKNE